MAKKIVVLYAHPNPKSFNHAILDSVVAELKSKGAEVNVRDLYALNFNPNLTGADWGTKQPDVAREQEIVKDADGFVIIYPIWWFAMPAILKGYIDRVIAGGFAYEAKDGKIIPKLAGKKVVIVNTTGNSKSFYESGGYYNIFKTVVDQGLFGFVGCDVVEHVYYHAPGGVSQEEREKWLQEVKLKADKCL